MVCYAHAATGTCEARSRPAPGSAAGCGAGLICTQHSHCGRHTPRPESPHFSVASHCQLLSPRYSSTRLLSAIVFSLETLSTLDKTTLRLGEHHYSSCGRYALVLVTLVNSGLMFHVVQKEFSIGSTGMPSVAITRASAYLYILKALKKLQLNSNG